MDEFTETTTTSYGGGVKNAFKNIGFGGFFILVALITLFWNEGSFVETQKTLDEGERVAISVADNKVNPANDGKLIHTTGKMTTKAKVKDDIFGITTSAVALNRSAQMYQWEEEAKSHTEESGGEKKTVTKYNYHKVWSNTLIDSSKFKREKHHKNPSSMPITSLKIINPSVWLGEFKLTKKLLSQSLPHSDLKFTKDHTNIEKLYRKRSRVQGNEIYVSYGGNINSPKIGDIRVSFSTIEPQDVSILAKQIKNTFEPYIAKAGGKIFTIESGLISKENIFKTKHEGNVFITWILRGVGLLVMFIGFKMLLGFIGATFKIIPILGNIVDAGTGLIAFIMALILSFITIAIAWLFYRPIISIGLLVICIGLLFIPKLLKKKAVSKMD